MTALIILRHLDFPGTFLKGLKPPSKPLFLMSCLSSHHLRFTGAAPFGLLCCLGFGEVLPRTLIRMGLRHFLVGVLLSRPHFLWNFPRTSCQRTWRPIVADSALWDDTGLDLCVCGQKTAKWLGQMLCWGTGDFHNERAKWPWLWFQVVGVFCFVWFCFFDPFSFSVWCWPLNCYSREAGLFGSAILYCLLCVKAVNSR